MNSIVILDACIENNIRMASKISESLEKSIKQSVAMNNGVYLSPDKFNFENDKDRIRSLLMVKEILNNPRNFSLDDLADDYQLYYYLWITQNYADLKSLKYPEVNVFFFKYYMRKKMFKEAAYEHSKLKLKECVVSDFLSTNELIACYFHWGVYCIALYHFEESGKKFEEFATVYQDYIIQSYIEECESDKALELVKDKADDKYRLMEAYILDVREGTDHHKLRVHNDLVKTSLGKNIDSVKYILDYYLSLEWKNHTYSTIYLEYCSLLVLANSSYRYYMAKYYLKTKTDYKLLIEYYKGATFTSNDKMNYDVGLICYENGEYGHAYKFFERMVGFKEYKHLYLDMQACCVNLNMMIGTLQCYNKYKCPESAYNCGLYYRNDKQMDSAFKYFKEAMEGGIIEAYSQMALILIKVNNEVSSEAIEYLTKGIEHGCPVAIMCLNELMITL